VDLELLLEAADRLPNVMVTVAPESTTIAQIRAMADAGIHVSLGHTNATFDTCLAAFDSGAGCFTHLFNAMSQLGSREPGLVGAALGIGELSTGLIADGVHVHPETIALALAAKRGPGRVFLVSDAMATAGSAIEGFSLNGRWIARRDGRLVLGDGTLAGADLELTSAVRNVVSAGAELRDALAMATSAPAGVAGLQARAGFIAPGRSADFIALDARLSLAGVWRRGVALRVGPA